MSHEPDELAALAVLAEPLRRRLYRHVTAQAVPVSRESAATALGVPRSVAAFHLDKLAELGLLEVEYRRPPGRGGPGAGRPAKLYRRATRDVALSVPERHYDLAALLLAEAVEEAAERGVPASDVLPDVARTHGRTLGAQVDRAAKRSRKRLLGRLAELLAESGYEPHVTGATMALENCPFAALAEEHRALICAMNLALVEGMVEELPGVSAHLDPAPERCCVTLVGRGDR
ncbi:MAG: helix-turn-helix domain-containing protein [Acidimicrobiales bacterium]